MSKNINNDCAEQLDGRFMRFGKQLILEIVQEVEKGLCRKQACERYGMTYGTLSEWMRKHGSENYHASKKAVFPLKTKRTVVRAVTDGRLTKEEACIAYRLERSLLNKWLCKFKRQEYEIAGLNDSSVTMQLPHPCESNIQKELSDSILKIRALETMIDVAEEQFKISIRKKSGAKQ